MAFAWKAAGLTYVHNHNTHVVNRLSKVYVKLTHAPNETDTTATSPSPHASCAGV